MGVKFATQIGHIAFDNAGISIEVVLPDMIQDLSFREDSIGVEHQIAQQFEFCRGELDANRPNKDLVGVLIHGQCAHADQGVIFFVERAAQDCFDPRDNLIQAKGLGYIVIAAHGEAGDLVLGRVFGGEEEYGAGVTTGSEPFGHPKSVDIGQHDIENNQVRFLIEHGGDGLRSGCDGSNSEAGKAKACGEQIPNVGFVINDKYFWSISHVTIIWENPVRILNESWAISE